MRVLRIIVAIVLTMGASNVYSQQKDTTNDKCIILKAEILYPGLVAGTEKNFVVPGFAVEKCFKRRHSFQIGFRYFNNIRTDNYGTIRHEGFNIQPCYKYYLSKKKTHNGFYLGLSAGYINYHETGEGLEYKQNIITAGIPFGYQTYVAKRIVIDGLLDLGIHHLLNTNIIYQSYPFESYEGKFYFCWKIMLKVGYRFNYYK